MKKKLLAAAIITLSQTGNLYAQNEFTLEEVLVTGSAIKTETTVQNTAASVHVLGDETLGSRSIIGLEDLQAILPNAQIGRDELGSGLIIRGVSNGAGSAGDASIAYHDDGVYTRVPTSLFYDLERVEAIYGPQGILYGRNATGGALNVISNKPDATEFDANLEHTIGNYSRNLSKGMVNIPLLEDRLAIRLAGVYEKRDGYNSNSLTARSSGADADRSSTRLSLAFTPNDDISLIARATTNNIRGIGNGSVPNTKVEVVDPASSQVLTPSAASLALLTPEQYQRNLDDPREYPFASDGKTSLKDTSYSIDFEWQLGNIALNYIAGIKDSDSGESQGELILPTSTLGDIRENDIDEQSHEFRLRSNTDNSFQWTVGAFAYETDRSSNIVLDFNDGGLLEDIELDVFSAKSTAQALFLSMSYQLSDQLSMTAGARHSKDKKRLSQRATTTFNPFLAGLFGLPPSITAQITNKADFSHNDGSIGLDFQLNDNSLWYAKISTGYKAGGLNESDNAELFFDQEEITAYEIGSKNSFLDNNLLVNTAVFNYKYDDYQVITQDPVDFTKSIVSNANAVEIFGAELNVQYITGALLLSTNLSYLDASFDDGIQLRDATLERDVDVSGLELKNAPEFSGNIAAQYQWQLSNAELNLSSDVYFSSKTNLSFTPLVNSKGQRVDQQDAYQRVDLSLSYLRKDTGNIVELFIKNATDEDIATAFKDANSGFAAFNYDAPRTYGLRFKVNY